MHYGFPFFGSEFIINLCWPKNTSKFDNVLIKETYFKFRNHFTKIPAFDLIGSIIRENILRKIIDKHGLKIKVKGSKFFACIISFCCFEANFALVVQGLHSTPHPPNPNPNPYPLWIVPSILPMNFKRFFQ